MPDYEEMMEGLPPHTRLPIEHEPLTQAELGRLRRAIERDTLTGYPVEKVALIDTALHYEARLREVEAMLVATSEHADHWQERAEKAEARAAELETAYDALGERFDKVIAERDQLRKENSEGPN